MSASNAGRQNQLSIPDAEDLYRRIVADWIIRDQTGRTRLASAAFRQTDKRVSVDRSSLTTAEACLHRGDQRHVGIVAVTAGQVRVLGEVVVPAPLEDNPAHAEILGPKHKASSKRLAGEFARWVYPPGASPVG